MASETRSINTVHAYLHTKYILYVCMYTIIYIQYLKRVTPFSNLEHFKYFVHMYIHVSVFFSVYFISDCRLYREIYKKGLVTSYTLPVPAYANTVRTFYNSTNYNGTLFMTTCIVRTGVSTCTVFVLVKDQSICNSTDVGTPRVMLKRRLTVY